MIYELSRQSSSSCSQCERQMTGSNQNIHNTHNIQNTHHIESFQNKTNHSNGHFQQSLVLMQHQIQELKQQNIAKDHIISELRREMDQKHSKNNIQTEIEKQSRQLQRIKQEIISPRVISQSRESAINHPTAFREDNSQMMMMQQQLRKYRQQLEMVRMKNEQLQGINRWMFKFIETFIKMAHGLSVNHGDTLDLDGLTLKKQTSMSWRYVKNLLVYLLQK